MKHHVLYFTNYTACGFPSDVSEGHLFTIHLKSLTCAKCQKVILKNLSKEAATLQKKATAIDRKFWRIAAHYGE